MRRNEATPTRLPPQIKCILRVTLLIDTATKVNKFRYCAARRLIADLKLQTASSSEHGKMKL